MRSTAASSRTTSGRSLPAPPRSAPAPPPAALQHGAADHGKLIIVGPSQIYGSTHYHLDGPTNAQELVVFLHGLGDACYNFELMANALAAAGYRTLRFDFFGRGFSEAPDDCRYDVDYYVGHTQSLLQRLNLADMPVVVVGHSMGGLVAMSYCEMYPGAPPKSPACYLLFSACRLGASVDRKTQRRVANDGMSADLVTKLILMAPSGYMDSAKIPGGSCCPGGCVASLCQRWWQLFFCCTPIVRCCCFPRKDDSEDHLLDVGAAIIRPQRYPRRSL